MTSDFDDRKRTLIERYNIGGATAAEKAELASLLGLAPPARSRGRPPATLKQLAIFAAHAWREHLGNTPVARDAWIENHFRQGVGSDREIRRQVSKARDKLGRAFAVAIMDGGTVFVWQA